MTEHKNPGPTTCLTPAQTAELAAANAKDDNTALVLSKLQALAAAAHKQAAAAAASYDDDHAKSLHHAGQAFLLASEATHLQDEHARRGGERLGPHDNAAADARCHAQLAAAATEGAWEGEAS